ncbi:LAMP family protein lmp-1-like [Panulirus ornatus]|uniref:LAMP family protein lmp-1-like n=1 Tax=Panulirus ornatus TaxID=150431 RepID=UPI003A8B720B
MFRFTLSLVFLVLLTGSLVRTQDDESEVDLRDSTTTEDPITTTTTKAPTTEASTTKSPTTTVDPTTTTEATTTTTTTASTTTTTPTTTTTTEAITTTTPEDTTTDAPTTTSPEPPTTTEIPTTVAPDAHYSVKDGNITCVMIDGEISFTVNYTTTKNATEVVTVKVPSHGASVDGTCNGTDGTQSITLSWGEKEEISSATMTFTESKDNWEVSSFVASLFMDNNTFPNTVNLGNTLELVMYYDLSPIEVAVNHSFTCHSSLSTTNVTGTIGKDDYSLPLASALDAIQIEAFNKIPNEPDFLDSVHCTADNTSDVVPIAVGCALAGLVIIVLIAYLVGRRRRSGAYQSV